MPASPAIYVDDATGREVTEDWWPGDEYPMSRRHLIALLCVACDEMDIINEHLKRINGHTE